MTAGGVLGAAGSFVVMVSRRSLDWKHVHIFNLILLNIIHATSTAYESYSRDELPPYVWCYSGNSCGQNAWTGKCAPGTNVQQSPINLKRSNLNTQPEEELLRFPRSQFLFSRFYIFYHAQAINLKPKDIISRPGLKFRSGYPSSPSINYRFESLHIHLGSRDDIGSEHAFEQKSFPAELHLVFYDHDNFDDIQTANNDVSPTSILTVSIFLEISEETQFQSKFLEPVVKYLGQLEDSKRLEVPDTFNLSEVFQSRKAYSYSGSYTAPNCKRMSWLVFTTPISVPRAHMAALRSAQVSGASVPNNNFRNCDA